MPGPVPKPPSKRRRVEQPKSYGGAAPVVVPAAGVHDRELGFDGPVHKLIESMWEALAESCEARFYSAADWERARLELWHANTLLVSEQPIRANSWSAVQNGLSALLISPAEKRRCGIELTPTSGDKDEDAAVLQMVKYQAKLSE